MSKQDPPLDPFNTALADAYALIAKSDKLEAEIGSKLLSRGFEPEVVNQVLHRLAEKKVLDDRKVILGSIESAKRKGRGSERIRADLLKRGAREEMLTEALEASATANPREVLEKKFGPGPFDKAKAARFLFSRGFPQEEIEETLAFE